jgi:hypothetical protein
VDGTEGKAAVADVAVPGRLVVRCEIALLFAATVMAASPDGSAGGERRSLYVFDCAAGTPGFGERGGRLPEAAPALPRSGLERLLFACACGR